MDTPQNDLTEIINNRLKQLHWSKYYLANEYGKSIDKEIKPTRYQSTVNQCLKDVYNSRLELVNDLVTLMGGTIKIVWENHVIETRLTLQENRTIKERLDDIELSLKDLQQKLDSIISQK